MILIAPDKFKGTLTSAQVGRAIADALGPRCPSAPCQMADGGEGTAATLAAMLDLSAATVEGFNSMMEPIGPVTYFVDKRGSTVALDAASVLSLTLIDRPDVMHATSRPLGLLLAEIARRHTGAHILLGIGGTSTCDGGIGMLQALGARFNNSDRPVTPLDTVESVDLSRLATLPPVTVLSDVDVKLGQALDFAAQKGAARDDMPVLGRFLDRLDRLYPRPAGGDSMGAGAAGGIGLALARCLGATMTSGAGTIVGMLEERLDFTPGLVITGEGCLDSQSPMGKLPWLIARRFHRRSTPVVAVAGCVAPDYVDDGTFDLIIDCSRYSLPGERLDTATARRRLVSAITHNLDNINHLSNSSKNI